MALAWRTKRQLTIFGILAGVVIILGYLYIAPKLKVQVTCFDGVQNGSETGVDCGGSCALVCPNEAKDLVVRFSRAYPINSDLFTTLAYVENQNTGAGIKNINYEFRFYDQDNLYIGSRKGSTFIGPTGRFLIFEPAINAGNREIKSTLFSFTSVPVWEKIDRRFETFPLFAQNIEIINEQSTPRVNASIANNSVYDVSNLDVIALIYDKDGNTIGASKTFLELVPKGDKVAVYFTWPQGFGTDVGKVEVIPQLNPFSLKL